MADYNDKIDADEQIEAEEQIAAMIFDCEVEDTEGNPIRLPEGECAQLGRDILKAVLTQFRPDFFDAIDADTLGAER